MTSLRINPLDIPEIRSMVGQYLGRSNLARCLRVCKSWHASFVPLVWSTFLVVSDLYSRGHDPLLLEAFIRYRHYLKYIVLRIDAPEVYRLTPCPNLLRLRVDVYRSKESESIDIVPVEIAQYEQLRYLQIIGNPNV
ncbi:MAG: hypothetical protein J3Q66DRAFT_405045 [Benniella sp.]|nr:MAG: hypothetical protein J3Q66DRAFT_405045 [Benniella sp.]